MVVVKGQSLVQSGESPAKGRTQVQRGDQRDGPVPTDGDELKKQARWAWMDGWMLIRMQAGHPPPRVGGPGATRAQAMSFWKGAAGCGPLRGLVPEAPVFIVTLSPRAARQPPKGPAITTSKRGQGSCLLSLTGDVPRPAAQPRRVLGVDYQWGSARCTLNLTVGLEVKLMPSL